MKTPTTWPEWSAWVKKQRKRTPWSFVLDVLPNGHPNILEAETFYRLRLNHMIRRYAKSPKRWPNMDPMERSLLVYRFDCAESLLGVLARSPFPSPKPDEFAAVVEWLLITCWFGHGEFHWSDYQSHAQLALRVHAPVPVPSRPEEGFAA
jgi:hypothetical protein